MKEFSSILVACATYSSTFLTLMTPRENEPSGIFSTQGKESWPIDLAQLVLVTSKVRGVGDFRARQRLAQIDLVGAAQDRNGIIDHRHAARFRHGGRR